MSVESRLFMALADRMTRRGLLGRLGMLAAGLIAGTLKFGIAEPVFADACTQSCAYYQTFCDPCFKLWGGFSASGISYCQFVCPCLEVGTGKPCCCCEPFYGWGICCDNGACGGCCSCLLCDPGCLCP